MVYELSPLHEHVRELLVQLHICIRDHCRGHCPGVRLHVTVVQLVCCPACKVEHDKPRDIPVGYSGEGHTGVGGILTGMGGIQRVSRSPTQQQRLRFWPTTTCCTTLIIRMLEIVTPQLGDRHTNFLQKDSIRKCGRLERISLARFAQTHKLAHQQAY